MLNKKKIWFPLALAAVLFSLYIYGNNRGIRYCNCKNTEDWKPGETRNTRGSSGHGLYYHK